MKKRNGEPFWYGTLFTIVAIICYILIEQKKMIHLQGLLAICFIMCLFLGALCWGVWMKKTNPYHEFIDIKDNTIINILHLNHNTKKDNGVILMVEWESENYLITTERSSFYAKDPLPGYYTKKDGKLSRIEFTDKE